MLKFDVEKFMQDGKATYQLRDTIEKVVNKVFEVDFENVILTGVGGTIFEMKSVKDILKKYSDIDVKLVNAAEGLIKKPKNINDKTIVVTGSKSGDTIETVNFASWCKSVGARVISFTGENDNPLANASTYTVVSDIPGMENTYLKLYLFATYLLYKVGSFPEYERFADQMYYLHDNLARWRKEYNPIAKSIADRYALVPYQMWIGSGVVWGEIELFTTCILEEMQWMKTRAVHSADFFHGPLELVDDSFPIYLVKGEDEFRELDNRVERFLKKLNLNNVVVIDTKDFILENIDEEFRYILSPIIFNNITRGRLCYQFEAITNHDLDSRRYYRQFEY